MATRAFVGLRRIPFLTRPSQASHTRDARAQFREISRNLKQIIRSVEGATPDAVRYALQPIWEESQVLCPVDTGKLKASGYFEVRETARGVEAEIGYGVGGNPHYAIYVHEIPMRHKSPTRDKFLEIPINNHMNEILPRIEEYLGGIFK